MAEPDNKENIPELLNTLEEIEEYFSERLMKKYRKATREAITKITGIMPEAKIDTDLFIAKSLIREDMLDILYELNKVKNN